MDVDQLSAVFGALADPTRRAILARLAEGDPTVAELAAPFRVSQPAISRHLKVLEEAGLISRHREATARLSHLEAEPLREATEWLVAYQAYWDESYERLDALLVPSSSDRSPAGCRRPDEKGRMMGTTKTTAPDGVPFIDITREFDAPRDLVFRAYTEPELVKQWLGPRGYEMDVDEYDVRDGGRWRYIHKDRKRQRVRLPRRVPWHPVDRRDRPDIRVRGRAGPRLPREAHLRGARRRPHPCAHIRLPVARGPRRDGRVRHGDGVNEGFDRLDSCSSRSSRPSPDPADTREENPMD